MRPSLWGFFWLNCFAGFVMAQHRLNLSPLQEWLSGLVAAGIWAVLLAGPGMALTSYFNSNQEEEQTGGRVMPWVMLTLVLGGLLLAINITWGYFDIYLFGFILTIMYAAPPLRLAGFRWAALPAEALAFAALPMLAGHGAAGYEQVEWLPVLYSAGLFLLYIPLQTVSGRLQAGLVTNYLPLALGIAALAAGVIFDGHRWWAILLALPLVLWILAAAKREQIARVQLAPAAASAAWIITIITLILIQLLSHASVT